MKINDALFAELRDAIESVSGISSGASMRQRWDTLWASKFDVNKLYRSGLDDGHIDTALRRIARKA